MARNTKKDDDGIKIICRNKRAFHEYEIHETIECGLVLTGTEVKSLREGSSSLEDAYGKLDGGEAWLKYKVDGTERNRPVEVSDDWADTLTINYVMDNIERDGRRFYFKDNGQAMILYYLDPRAAAELNRLSKNALKPAIPE